MVYYICKTCGWSGEVVTRPRCLECHRRRTRQWRIDNPEKAREQKRRYDKRYRATRREEYNAKRRGRRSSLRNAETRQRRIVWLIAGDATREQLIAIFEEAEGKCDYCKELIYYPRFSPYDPRGFDHVIARINGGTHTASNIVVCCRKCNALKGAKDYV